MCWWTMQWALRCGASQTRPSQPRSCQASRAERCVVMCALHCTGFLGGFIGLPSTKTKLERCRRSLSESRSCRRRCRSTSPSSHGFCASRAQRCTTGFRDRNPTLPMRNDCIRCCACWHGRAYRAPTRSTHGSSGDPSASRIRRSSACSARNGSMKIVSCMRSATPGRSRFRRPAGERPAKSGCTASASIIPVTSSADDSSPRTWRFGNGPGGRTGSTHFPPANVALSSAVAARRSSRPAANWVSAVSRQPWQARSQSSFLQSRIFRASSATRPSAVCRVAV